MAHARRRAHAALGSGRRVRQGLTLAVFQLVGPMISLYHIPICPFCQRLEILAELKGVGDITFEVVDITKPRDPHILALTGGSTALPVMELEHGRALKESLVLMAYLDHRYPDVAVRREDPYEAAIEHLMVTMEGPFTLSGYLFVMNNDRDKREALRERYLQVHRDLNDFLVRHASGDGPWLFDRFGWAEAVFTPMFQRFWFVAYYEGVDIPETEAFARVRAWRDACVMHPAAQQASREEIIKRYYDYARGAGNGALPEGRRVSTFAFEPRWQDRPWPPKDKFRPGASDQELGLTKRG